MNLFSLFYIKYFIQTAFVVYLVINPFECGNLSIILQSIVAYLAIVILIRYTAQFRFFIKTDNIDNVANKLKQINYIKLIYEADTKLIFKQGNFIVKYYPKSKEIKIYGNVIFKNRIMKHLS